MLVDQFADLPACRRAQLLGRNGRGVDLQHLVLRRPQHGPHGLAAQSQRRQLARQIGRAVATGTQDAKTLDTEEIGLFLARLHVGQGLAIPGQHQLFGLPGTPAETRQGQSHRSSPHAHIITDRKS